MDLHKNSLVNTLALICRFIVTEILLLLLLTFVTMLLLWKGSLPPDGIWCLLPKFFLNHFCCLFAIWSVMVKINGKAPIYDELRHSFHVDTIGDVQLACILK